MAKSLALQLEIAVGNAFNRAKFAAQAKVAEDARRAVGFAAFKGADAMRDRILASPTGTRWHAAISKQRGYPGGRFETGTMFGSVGRTRGKIVENADKRKQSSVKASFGWPTDSGGQMKDLPYNPLSAGSRMPDGPGWHDDPRYQLMQEYGFDNEGHWTPGMFSQREGAIAAKKALSDYFRKLGYK